ncbi:MAG: TraB/GumN family protein [Caldimonas sp.]
MNRIARLALAALAALPLALQLGAARAAPAPACPPQAAPLSPEAVAAGMRDARDHGFLWRLTKDGRVSFIYGTIHAARQAWMFPGPTVVEAMGSSDIVALELDVLDPEIQRRLVAGIGARRSDALPPALARRLERRRASECVDAASWSTFSPEFQIASLTVLAARRDGLDPAYAIDLVLARAARDLGKPVVSLESPEGQMEALQMPTQAQTVALVKDGLDDLDSGRARPLIRRIAKVWVDGNYAELARYEKWCDCARTPAERAAMKRLLDDRNPALAARIDELHAGGQKVFAAVGSLHMIGRGGLPALLKQRGYKVEQGDFER